MSKYLMRGEVYWISLDPTVGSEVKKTRPGLILSNNSSNKHSKRVIIGPITSSVSKVYPFEAKVELPKGTSKVMLDQIRTVDKMRLGSQITTISSEEMRNIERALKITFALS